MNTRARFEEIWPVPEGVYWHEEAAEYWTSNHTYGDSMDEWKARLDTFTRCQETTDVYVSLIEELVGEIEKFERATDLWLPEYVETGHCEEAAALHALRGGYLFTLERAKQILGDR